MKFFKGKEEKIIDLSNYKKQEDWPFNKESSDDEIDLDSEKSQDPENRKKKFAKRITELTNNFEDLTNQIYHLQQRVELLEKKLNINRE